MDKTIMLAGLIFISLPVVVLTLMIGWLMDDNRDNKGKCDTDSDTGICFCAGSGNRRSDKRCSEQEIEELAKKLNVKIGESNDINTNANI